MGLLKYNEYISEKVLIEMLFESKLVLSNNFTNIISRIPNNKIADKLLYLNRKEVDGIKQNFIDITDRNNQATFTPDKKAQELNKNVEGVYVVNQQNRYLTHSDKNNRVFAALGYDKETTPLWTPDIGDLGLVMGETTRPSGNTYVLFKEYNAEEPRVTVLNKEAISLSDDVDNPKTWETSRNPMNVGRLVRAILNYSDLEFTNQDLEDFVNKYKAMYDLSKDAMKQFDLVSGDKIAHWYDMENYQDGGGQLNNSCMGDVGDYFFDIYTTNDNVELLILYGDKGDFDSSGRYTSDKIKGRALVWNCTIDGTPGVFMDRIYSTKDSDMELFKQYAQQKKWWYKKNQTMNPNEDITNGKISKSAIIECELNTIEYEYYPYMDTLCYLVPSSYYPLATNNSRTDYEILARETDGTHG